MGYRFLLLLVCFCALMHAPGVQANEGGSLLPGLSIEEIVTLKQVRQVALNPRGDLVAYLLEVPRQLYQQDSGPAWKELHVVDLAGSSHAILEGPVNVSTPVWSSDSKRLYFLANAGNGSEFPAIQSAELSGGAVEIVYQPAFDIEALRLSPDGKTLAFLSAGEKAATQGELDTAGFRARVYGEEARLMRLWQLDLATHELAATYLPGSVSEFAWSPDGTRLGVAVAATPSADDMELGRDILIVESALPSSRVAMQIMGKLAGFSWSPDGSRIAYIAGEDSADPNPGRLFVQPAIGGSRAEWLPGYLGQVEDFAWTGKDSIAYVGSIGLGSEIAIAKAGPDKPTAVFSNNPDGVIWQSLDVRGVKPGETTLALVGHSPAHPSEVYVIESGRLPRRLTDSNPLLHQRRLARQERIRFAARDGLEIEALVVHPLDPIPAPTAEPVIGAGIGTVNEAAPLIIFAHGGPEGHYADGWLSSYEQPAQALAVKGYRLLFPNYRGSTARGVAFSRAGQGDPAGAEFDDLADAREYLVNQGLADPARVGITGISYGGYAAMWAATRQTRLFAAAVAFAGMSSLASGLGSSDIPREWRASHLQSWPWDDWSGMLQRSPVFHVGDAQTPLLIAAGELDERFTPAQSLELYQHLTLRTETPVRLVTYPGEGHGLRHTAARFDYALRLEQWMDHYLMGPGGAPPAYELNHGSRMLTRNAADAMQAAGSAPKYDLVIRGGRVLDGTGKPAESADIAIRDGRFVLVGTVTGRGQTELDAHGRYISPGWIDMMDQSGEALLQNGLAENKLLMGVTTAFGGEGGTPVPAARIPEYFAKLERQGLSLNFGSYYNAFQAREAVVGESEVTVTEAQLEQMRGEMLKAMQAGVVGMSSAAFYPPASFMSAQELVELGKVIAPFGGIHAAHLRDESRKLLEAISELITVGEQAGIRVEIFHFKNAFAPNWGSTVYQAIDLIEAARARGVDVAANQYPYIAGGSGIDATLPTRVFAQGREAGMALLADPRQRAGLKAEIADPMSDRMVVNAGGWQNIVLMSAFTDRFEPFEGMNFQEIGLALGQDPADAAWDIMLAALPLRANALYFLMSEPDVQAILSRPWVSIGSDAGSSLVLGQADKLGQLHPRAYGTFPRIIARYVRELAILSLPEAVRKMTSLPASRMRLAGRGIIQPGYWADAVIFDEIRLQDNATFEHPMRTPSGIDYVLVNGEVVVDHGRHTGLRPGQVLYGPGHDPAAARCWNRGER